MSRKNWRRSIKRIPSYVTEAVYNMLSKKAKYGGEPKRHMWIDLGTKRTLGRLDGSTSWGSF